MYSRTLAILLEIKISGEKLVQMMVQYLFAVFFTILVVIIGKHKNSISTAVLFLLVLLHTDKYTVIVFTITYIVLYLLLRVFLESDIVSKKGEKASDIS